MGRPTDSQALPERTRPRASRRSGHGRVAARRLGLAQIGIGSRKFRAWPNINNCSRLRHMADNAQVLLIMSGSAEWNTWVQARELGFTADLSGADLSHARLDAALLAGADLSGANCFQGDFAGAELAGANLSETNLSAVDMRRANLSGANMFHANLSAADVSDADLSGANVSTADLSETRANRTNLRGANLTEVMGFNANLSGADLSGANLLGAKIATANLTDCVEDEHTIWPVKHQPAT